MKNHGAFEAELIRRLNPRLAQYPSSYGHHFALPPPWRRIVHDYLTYFRPPSLRRLTFRLKRRRRGEVVRTGYLRPDYVAAVLPDGAQCLDRLFRFDRLNGAQLGRIFSLEVAFKKLGGKVTYDF
jgi:asparagine synthase (glutamine-hydrolysing)